MTQKSFRQFGQYEKDLDIHFGQPQGPKLVTQVLQNCLAPSGDNGQAARQVWDMTVGDRIEALLRIASLSIGKRLTVMLDCQNQDCGQRIEIDLNLEAIVDAHNRTRKVGEIEVPLGEMKLTIRKPTGRDQLSWLATPALDETLAVKRMIKSLIVIPNEYDSLDALSNEQFMAIDKAVQDVDPLVGSEVTVACPYCEQANLYEIDLQKLGLDILRNIQIQLFRDIHHLAGRYHWTETEIMALPAWRRRQYLAYLEQEQSL